jgi:hypothetical protein
MRIMSNRITVKTKAFSLGIVCRGVRGTTLDFET